MSWSISFIGTPENLVKAMEAYSEKLDVSSKEEYDAALPHLVGLVNQIYNEENNLMVRVTANGHAYFRGEKKYSYCNVNIEQIAGVVV